MYDFHIDYQSVGKITFWYDFVPLDDRLIYVIDSIDSQLQTWVQSVAADATVSFAPPSAGDVDDTPRIHLYLLHIVPGLTRTNLPASNAVSELVLRYLVTVEAADPTAAHRLLGELAFAALENTDFDVESEPLPPSMWRAFGTPPQPALLLRVPLQRPRPQPEAPLVRQPLAVETASITALTGRIVGPDDVPLSGATVELPGLHLRQTTDPNGRFHFPTVPRTEQHSLRIRARGREMTVDVEPSDPGQPVIIRFKPLEEEG